MKFNRFLLIGLVLLTGCWGVNDHSLYERIVDGNKGLVRNKVMGMSMAEVKASEKIQPEDEDEGYLYYRIGIGENNSLATTYSFSQSGLYEIQLEVYLNDLPDASDLNTVFLDSFREKYGEPEEKNGSLIWVLETENSKEIEVTIIDESKQYGYGKLSVSFYDFDN